MKGALGLHTHADISGVRDVEILKVLGPEEYDASPFDAADILVFGATRAGSAGSFGARGQACDARIRVASPRDPRVVQPGDVVRLREGSSLVSVLYRRGSAANTLFATERCNSRCLMCSQPPREDDDSWRVAELARTIALVDRDEVQLGISGGEPTLLGDDLAHLIALAGDYLPDTQLHVLTNGRLFAERGFAEALAVIRPAHVIWAVPLYGDVADLHDRVIDAPGAFEETLAGLYELGRLGARVEIRVVLHALTVPRLEALASFVYRRLPFVEHVALMGLEPMGFAKQNRDLLAIDPVDYAQPLAGAVFHLANRGMAVSIYNLPLCVLERDLWPFAQRSISDWKNVFPEICSPCTLADRCSGFFASAGPAWRSRAIAPFLEQVEAT